MVLAIRRCECGRQFRPGSELQVRCSECVTRYMFGMTDDPPETRVMRWDVPPGICARPSCHKPFKPESYNQRYCSLRCRFAAVEERRALREAARRKLTKGLRS